MARNRASRRSRFILGLCVSFFASLFIRRRFLAARRSPRRVHLTDESPARLPEKLNLKLLCLIPTVYPLSKNVEAIKRTWGARCDELLFTSYASRGEKDIVVLPNIEKSENLWGQVHPAFTHVVESGLLETFDWVLKTDDDAYIVVDNLRTLLDGVDPSEPFYFGHTQSHAAPAFNAGAGYLLSRGALEKVAPLLPSSKRYDEARSKLAGCRNSFSWAEDLEMARCLAGAKIYAANSLDEYSREVFLPFTPVDHFHMVRRRDSTSWFWRGKRRETGSGMECCGRYPVLFHGIKASDKHYMLYMLEYLFYELVVR